MLMSSGSARPDHLLGANGSTPGGHTVVCGKMPAMYVKSSAVMLAQLGAGAVTSIHQHRAALQTGLAGPVNLFKRDLWLGLEIDVVGHS